MTQTLENLADKLLFKRKPFAETFKSGSDMPKFDGQIWSWPKWKRKFLGFLGENNLSYLLDPNTDITTVDNHEKNKWLHYAFQLNLESTALNKVKQIPRDLRQAHCPIIPDRRESWNKIKKWYEGSAVKDTMRTYAHTKIC